MRAPGRTLDLFEEAPLPRPSRPALRPLPGPDRSRRAATAVENRSQSLWLAIHLPQLALEALCGQGSSELPPLAVLESSPTQRVVDCSAAASSLGISRGMGTNAAYALCGTLRTFARDPLREQRLLQRLAVWAGGFTPAVSLEEPDGVLLEIRGSLRLFGGLEGLLAQVGQGLAQRRCTAALAVAPTPLASLWLARAEIAARVEAVADLSAVLGKLATGVLRWPESSLELLESMGVGTLGDCLRLPRDGLARRLGPERLLELDRAVGRLPQARRRFLPRTRFMQGIAFEEEITTVDLLESLLQPLFRLLAEFLRHRQAGIQSCELKLRHRHLPDTRVVLRFASTVGELPALLDILEGHLQRLVLPAPVRGARLRSGPLLQRTGTGRRFFFAEQARDRGQGEQVIERLRARLGAEALYRLTTRADHRPEVAGGRNDLATVPAQTAVESGVMRPLWLLPEPRPLKTKQGWPCQKGRLVLDSGPERIESGWWDGAEIRRDYYQARTPRGVRLWIYRERTGRQCWFLHGLFG